MKTKRVVHIMLSLMLAFCLLLVTGCNSNEKAEIISQEINEKPIIAVTIVPEQTFVKAVCGDLADVIAMVPPGNSPENYEPSPKEMEKFSKASLYFSIGVPTEEANILPKAGNVKVISLQDEVASVYKDRTFASAGRDPHIWLSPKRVKVMIEAIAREMCKLDGANKDIYTKNAEAYIKQLDELDKQISSALENVKSKKFIVYHPAFGYFADDYGLQMYALEQDGKEATPQHLQEMIDLAKKENIKVIFYQEEIDSSQSEAFAEEIGGKAIQLSPLAADYIGNLKIMAETMAEVMQ
ncbi:metal ABC transporter solute-binding protein, Zn/Mn family [Dehalobacterium formicoaceticum]|uniref:metal ABC transporter solute-binding protein, Zn/Mn family n=1 Tax=Dehalobacterium formicoaceticum TaxID=51515 RepID=UPI0031F6BA09